MGSRYDEKNAFSDCFGTCFAIALPCGLIILLAAVLGKGSEASVLLGNLTRKQNVLFQTPVPGVPSVSYYDSQCTFDLSKYPAKF